MGTPIDLEKLRSLAVIGRRTRDQVTERRDDAGRPVKSTTDELGNTVTQHWHDRQDVHINAPTVKAQLAVREVRD